MTAWNYFPLHPSVNEKPRHTLFEPLCFWVSLTIYSAQLPGMIRNGEHRLHLTDEQEGEISCTSLGEALTYKTQAHWNTPVHEWALQHPSIIYPSDISIIYYLSSINHLCMYLCSIHLVIYHLPMFLSYFSISHLLIYNLSIYIYHK